MLLDRGLNLPQVPTAVGKLLTLEKPAVIWQKIQDSHHDSHHRAFEEMCQRAGVSLPEVNPKKAGKQGKVARQKTHQANQANMVADPNHYALKHGYFVNADKTPTQVITNFSPTKTGVMLSDNVQALQWLQVTQEKVPDELALFVLGPIDIPSHFVHELTTAPAADLRDREVILQGTLVQFGQRHVGIASSDHPNTDVKDTIVASVTIWKCDFEQALWTQAVQHPVRTVQRLLTEEGFHGILLKPWGRQFQCDGVQCEPHRSTSIQFHAEFAMGANFLALLRRSGFSRIYIHPKSSTGEPDSRWRVIWLGKNPNIPELESKIATSTGMAGLVRTKRGMGIRVETGHFNALWTKLHPDMEPPSQEIMKYVFKLQPVPLGVDGEVLQKWASDHYAWRIKPLKAVGAKQWIISSNTIPNGIIQSNSQPMILQQLPQKGSKTTSAIAAGPRMPSQNPGTSTSKEAPNAFRTGDPHMDPWMPASLSRKNVQDTPTPSRASSAAASDARTISGPISERLQQQDAKLLELEVNMKQLQDSQEKQFQVVNQQQQSFDAQLKQHSQHTQKGFDFLRNEQQTLKTTVTEALYKQEGKLTQTFEDLKALIINQRGQKRDGPEPGDEDDMTHGEL
eukprot:Skav235690  [mRNA]  locus=scaffold280:143245:145113:- [translate_table: standard]